ARSPAPAPASAADASVRSATARVSSTASAAASPPASSPRTPSATAATAIAIPAPIRYFFISDIACPALSLRSVPPSVAGTRPADRRSCRGRAGRPRRGPPALDPTGSMHRARPCGLEPPRSLPADQVDRVEPDQHFPRLRPVRRTQDPGGVQLVDDTRCPAVPDPEPSLQERGRALLVLDADLGRLSEERVALLRERVRALLGGLGLVCADDLEDVLLEFRRRDRTLPVPRHHPLRVLRRQEGALDADRIRLARRQEEHVAVAEQRVRAVL